MMHSLFQYWRRLFFAQVPPHCLALMRIALGLTLLVFWLRYAADVPMMFSSDGPVFSFWEPQSGSLSILLTPPPVWAAWMLYTIFLGSIAGITLGWHYRTACIAAIILITYFSLLSFHNFLASWSRLLYFTLIVLSMSSADRTLSLRMKTAKGSWTAWDKVPVWPQRIIAIQITATYLGVGMQKAYLPDWQGGEILAYSFINMWSTPFAFAIARLNIPIVFFDALTWCTKILHGLLPIGLWSARFQKWCFLGGALFHLTITATMGMWWFLLLIPLYAAFVDPEKMRRIMNRGMQNPHL